MISKGYKAYLKKRKLFNLLVHLFQVLLIIIILFVWQFLADHNIINTFISSSPKLIYSTIKGLYLSNNLFHHIWITIMETIISFILATLLGLIIAIILWSSKFIAKVLNPYLIILNSLPKVSIGPILIIWIGANNKSIIVMALLISLIITIINIYNGFISVDINKVNLLKSFGASKYQILKHLVLPSNYKNIISCMKINVSMCLIGVITGELLVSKEGIGYLIMYGSQVFNLNLVMSGIIILMFVSYLMYLFIGYIEKILIKND